MKVLVFIDHDIICRHFVTSGALAPLVAAADVGFVFPADGGKRVTLDPASLPLGAWFERLPIDARRVQLRRWALFADQLKLRRGPPESAIRRLRWQTLGWKAGAMLTMAGLPGIESIFLNFLDRRLAQRPNRALADLMDRERPDVVLHPSVLEGVFINDLVGECRTRGVPLVVVMNSWDNPSTKRAVVGTPDWLLVWGAQTRDHSVRFMGIEADRVVPFGAAQFDVFRERQRIDRAAFAAAHAIDPGRRIVLFAGSNAQTDEFATLSALDQSIEEGRLENTAIVYRPHPWGEGGRNGARLSCAQWRHVRIHEAMLDYVARLAAGPIGITLPDYRDTHDILSVADLVVSPLSTILVEAVLHAKPVIVYAPRGRDGSFDLNSKLPQIHFDEFLALDDVALAHDVNGLVALLPKLLHPVDAPRIGERLRMRAAEFVTPFERPWRERLVDFLRDKVDADTCRDRDRKVAAE